MHSSLRFLSDAQLAAQLRLCEFCEEKPCREACPAHCSPADFIMAARVGRSWDIARSAALIMASNPLGGVCGAVCPDHFCQKACVHRTFDHSVDIPAVQAEIVQRAKSLGVLPRLERSAENGRRVAIIGSGPGGLAAALDLHLRGYEVEIFEKGDRPGGALNLIPPHRMDPAVARTDVNFVLGHSGIGLHLNSEVLSPETLLNQGFDGVVVSCGRWAPVNLSIPGEDLAVDWLDYLSRPDHHTVTGAVAVIGGGAIACDCAVTARLAGACRVHVICLEEHFEMPLTANEKSLLAQHGIGIQNRTSVDALVPGTHGLDCHVSMVRLLDGQTFHPSRMEKFPGMPGTVRPGYDLVITAIGGRTSLGTKETSRIVLAGEADVGPATVVESVASGKNAASRLHASLNGTACTSQVSHRKSYSSLPGYNPVPVSLTTRFFGREIPSPFLLSAAPPSDGYQQMRKALDAGWAGGIMKTAFDGVPIHIPGEYMHVFDAHTYGNCDNVSGHSLDRVCGEIRQLVSEYPDRLIGASTGGPVTGNDEMDRTFWQANSRKLEDAGAMLVEFSLSCPQGGDGTEGDIVSQSPVLTAKIVDWVMQTGRSDVPKLFKLTGAVTSIAVILAAIRDVLDRYPGKMAGVTLANTFPVLDFRPRDHKTWDQGIVFGMSGAGVAPISYLTLATASRSGLAISGNGGPMDYLSAAHFLALGAQTVQFCTVATKHGVGIIDELHRGLSHLMQARGLQSVEELVGCALPHPVTDFMDLDPAKKVSHSDPDLCLKCGNCTRCPYLAISLTSEGFPHTDPALCIGCGICAKKCFSGAIHLRNRTPEEADMLSES